MNNQDLDCVYPTLSKDDPAGSCEEAAQGNSAIDQVLPMEQASTSGGISTKTSASTSQDCAESHQNTDTALMRDTLGKEAQQIIEEINAKRRQDTQLLADFRSSQEKHVEKTCAQLEQAMFDIYAHESKAVQGKLQQLFTILDRISNTEGELNQFKLALRALYRDMAHTQ